MKKSKNKFFLISTITFIIISVILGYKLYATNSKYVSTNENSYSMALYELVDYVQNVETYLAKSMITTNSNHGAETLTRVWREANLAQSYLGMLPIQSQELENTEKFLNQVSEYSYSLSRKTINDENLNEEDLEKLKQLYEYSSGLSATLNQLSSDLNNGTIKWKDLIKNKDTDLAIQVSNTDFTVIEDNFHEYEGLIYDGAFSEHLINAEKKGLTGEDIDEEAAKTKITEFIGNDKIKKIENNGFVENGNIPVFRFSVITNNDENIGISISQKGGCIVAMNNNKQIKEEKISEQDAVQKGKDFLNQKGFANMQETYYLKENGAITINYAYKQNDVIIYPDLIKVKISLDDGEILGIETSGYLNCHYERNIEKAQISSQKAKQNLNKNIEITSEGLAIIPTEWNTEILCYEFKGKVNEIEFIAYINAETGENQDVLIITNTENGTLTM